MRLSTREGDPGYKPGLFGVRVFVDDVETLRVFTADEEQGLVVVVDADADGRYKVIGDEVQTRTVYGRVRIELPERTVCPKN